MSAAGGSPLRVGFLGPAGTFCEEALHAALPDAEGVPFATEREAIMAVAAGDPAAAMVPIENSLEGGVTATLDTLALEAPPVAIAGEVVLPIRHCLIGRPGENVETVISHPQALAQCRRFLAAELPGVRELAATSTADAVRDVAGDPAGRAAIGTRSAASIYGLEVLREGIEDDPDNETRFVWVEGAPEEGHRAPGGGGAWKTSLVFHGSGDVSPGWLVRCLSEFAFRGINLTKIESRPRKKRLGHYLFLVDLEGNASEPHVVEAVTGLRAHCEEVRVLGTYRPAA